jgi:hypothetical protein
MNESETSVLLFSYGTLQLESVQMANFGRLLEGRRDTLPGYALVPYEITDPEVIAESGTAWHSMAKPTAESGASVPGMVFAITPEELEAADVYEVPEYQRIEVELSSGTRAFVYVGR